MTFTRYRGKGRAPRPMTEREAAMVAALHAETDRWLASAGVKAILAEPEPEQHRVQLPRDYDPTCGRCQSQRGHAVRTGVWQGPRHDPSGACRHMRATGRAPKHCTCGACY